MHCLQLIRCSSLLLLAGWLPAAAALAQSRPLPPRPPAPSQSSSQSAVRPNAKAQTRASDQGDKTTNPVRRAASQPTARDPATIFAGGAPRSVEELKAMQAVTQRLSEQVMQSTVGVRVGPAQGSGVIVTKEGHVLTAAHVAGSPGRNVTFILQDGRTVRGKTLGVFYDMDAGLMQITDPGPWKPAIVGDSNKLRIGQWCLGTGHPGGYQRDRHAVVRLGRILQLEDDGITTDITLVGGDSGGPLFDMQGRVIGIHSRIGNALTANVHVPSSAYRDNWDRLVKGEAWGTQPGIGPFIGVVGASDAKDARIAHVNPGSPAEKAGIAPGDVITRFDGHRIDDFASLSRTVRESDPGERVKVEVRRGERTLQLELIVGNRDD